MLSLIFDRPQITSTPSKLSYRAVLKCKIINRRYSNMWDIRQLFDYWRSRPDDKDLSETEIQTKLASLLFSICFIRIDEADEIKLAISNIDYRNQTAILCLSPNANNSIEQYEIRRTGDPKVCPNSTLFTWLDRHWLNSLLREIGIRGAISYSFKHAASTEIAKQGLDTTNLNIFTHLNVFSRAACNFCIYAANAGINELASQLLGNHGQSYTTQTISQQRVTPPTGSEEEITLAKNGCYITLSSNYNFKKMNVSNNNIVDKGGQSIYVVMTKLASWRRYEQLGEFVKGNYSDETSAEIVP
ncbi:MAG: hypothetical protein EZS28_017535 [Streblomastix strix]|uniref:Tyr recombinase domain-containing protein n=1 Tax=Streblomastix strix TaxID=222440 RepID=A0A5J4VWH8_9EUKA|nr:MAG: hypothetical protein EZS28_017535 [Streblomastix strix]